MLCLFILFLTWQLWSSSPPGDSRTLLWVRKCPQKPLKNRGNFKFVANSHFNACFLLHDALFLFSFFVFCFLSVQRILKSHCVLFPAADAGWHHVFFTRQPSVSLYLLHLSVFESRFACRCTSSLGGLSSHTTAAASERWRPLSLAALLCSAVGRDDPPGPLAHRLLLQHHLHGQQPQPQQPQQPAGGQRHRRPGQPGHAPNHGGLLLSPTPSPPPPTAFLSVTHTHTHLIVTYVPPPSTQASLFRKDL